MSTKIYDSYVLPNGLDPLVANLEVSKAVRSAYRLLALRAVGTVGAVLRDDTVAPRRERVATVVDALSGFADVTVEDVDRVLRPYTVEHGSVSNLRLAAAIVQAVNAAGRTIRIPNALDLQFSVSWMVDPQTNRVGGHDHYARIYTERPEYREAFLGATGATDFHYQNQSDRPDDVTDEQWEERRETWGRVMPGFEAPASFSPSWELTDVDRLEFESMRAKWLTSAAVCDELDTLKVFKPGARDDYEEWLGQRPAELKQVGT